jgi:hypothetical protein
VVSKAEMLRKDLRFFQVLSRIVEYITSRNVKNKKEKKSSVKVCSLKCKNVLQKNVSLTSKNVGKKMWAKTLK